MIDGWLADGVGFELCTCTIVIASLVPSAAVSKKRCIHSQIPIPQHPAVFTQIFSAAAA